MKRLWGSRPQSAPCAAANIASSVLIPLTAIRSSTSPPSPSAAHQTRRRRQLACTCTKSTEANRAKVLPFSSRPKLEKRAGRWRVRVVQGVSCEADGWGTASGRCNNGGLVRYAFGSSYQFSYQLHSNLACRITNLESTGPQNGPRAALVPHADLEDKRQPEVLDLEHEHGQLDA